LPDPRQTCEVFIVADECIFAVRVFEISQCSEISHYQHDKKNRIPVHHDSLSSVQISAPAVFSETGLDAFSLTLHYDHTPEFPHFNPGSQDKPPCF
jgi:hypothetical protein